MNVKKVVYVEMTREAAVDFGLEPRNLKGKRYGRKNGCGYDESLKVMPFEVDEAVADAIRKDQNRIEKEKERTSRCMISNGKGRLIRCEGKCSECSRTREPAFSVEESARQGVDFACDTDEINNIELKTIVSALIDKVREYDELAAEICVLYLKYEDKEIIENKLGITRSVLDKKLKKIARDNAEFNILR